MMENSVTNSKKNPRVYTTDLMCLLSGVCEVPAALNTVIHGVQVDSRKVKKGDLFLALSGCQFTSTDHIKDAIARGANAVVAEGTLLSGRVFEDGNTVALFVDNLKQKTGQIADKFFQSPSQDVEVIGVTGTNGKTSVTSYLAQYFALMGEKSGFIGTLGYGLSGEKACSTDNTTPNVVDVHRYLADLRDRHAKKVVMEVSSHGLLQGRTDDVEFVGAVFTNLTREHLDYHETMENYAEAKSLLFKRKTLRYVVMNNDDSYAEMMMQGIDKSVNVIQYGMTSKLDVLKNNTKKIKAQSCELASGIRAEVSTPIGLLSIDSHLIGRFNLSNLLAVVGVAVAVGHKVENLSLINHIKPVEGRMALVNAANQALVVVDYAHTPDALQKALEAIRAHCSGAIILVFGCGGDRDVGKRSEMGRIAEAIADQVIVTDDNPRNEDPEAIIADMEKGVDRANSKKTLAITNRKEAIKAAVSQANPNDIILIAGKGHETYQIIGDETLDFNDMEILTEYLKQFAS